MNVPKKVFSENNIQYREDSNYAIYDGWDSLDFSWMNTKSSLNISRINYDVTHTASEIGAILDLPDFSKTFNRSNVTFQMDGNYSQFNGWSGGDATLLTDQSIITSSVYPTKTTVTVTHSDGILKSDITFIGYRFTSKLPDGAEYVFTCYMYYRSGLYDLPIVFNKDLSDNTDILSKYLLYKLSRSQKTLTLYREYDETDVIPFIKYIISGQNVNNTYTKFMGMNPTIPGFADNVNYIKGNETDSLVTIDFCNQYIKNPDPIFHLKLPEYPKSTEATEEAIKEIFSK